MALKILAFSLNTPTLVELYNGASTKLESRYRYPYGVTLSRTDSRYTDTSPLCGYVSYTQTRDDSFLYVQSQRPALPVRSPFSSPFVGRSVGRKKCKLMFKHISSTRPSQMSRRSTAHISILHTNHTYLF